MEARRPRDEPEAAWWARDGDQEEGGGGREG